MHIGTKIYTFFRGFLIGKDQYGNKYYSNKKNPEANFSKRWVIFNGTAEASKIPSHWHAWLHKITDEAPINYKHKYHWQKDHIPNQTGTLRAYYPNSHPLNDNESKDQLEKEYVAWKPNK